ncbi:MAG: hypothetical protein ACTHJ6_03925 [Oryzihumus sp.]
MVTVRPHRRRRRWIGRIILLVLVVAVGIGGYLGVQGVVKNFGGPSCRAVASGQEVTFTPEQMANAATITAVAVRRGLPARAATIALATAIQESKLRNLRYGDRDSVGLFQQRPSQGWGTEEQILDPVYASNRFYDELVKVPGYQDMEITKVAQRVQKSAFPEAYADHEREGRVLASTLAGHSPGGLGCRLDAATTSRPATSVMTALAREFAVKPTAQAKRLTVRATSAQQAWALASWAVSHAEADGFTSVTVGERTWTRGRDTQAWSWSRARQPAPATTVVITRH